MAQGQKPLETPAAVSRLGYAPSRNQDPRGEQDSHLMADRRR